MNILFGFLWPAEQLPSSLAESRRACWWSRWGWLGRPPCRHPKAPPKFFGLVLPGFLLHSSPDMLNNIHIGRLCWPSLKDLLLPDKVHSGTWGMARSSILLTPLVVGNVLGVSLGNMCHYWAKWKGLIQGDQQTCLVLKRVRYWG